MTVTLAFALMISIAATAFAEVATTQPTTQPLGDDPLGELLGRKRVLVFIADQKSDERLTRQREQWRAEAEGFAERETVLIEIVGGASETLSAKAVAAVFRQLEADGRRFAVVLVGKDGGVKLREYEPVPARRLFDLIDSMPMRQREMNRGK